MCGIAGWYAREGVVLSEEVIARQCNAIIHRGPDDCGYHVEGDFGMGMRRLSKRLAPNNALSRATLCT